MEILFKNEKLGEISKIQYNYPWIVGEFQATDLYQKYVFFLNALLDEENFDETLFSGDLLDENNWIIIDGNDTFNIFPPAIYPDGSIYFRK